MSHVRLLKIDTHLKPTLQLCRIASEPHPSQMRFRALFEHSPEATAVMRGERTYYANQAFVEMFGYDSEEDLIARPVIEHIASSQRATVRRRMTRRATGLPEPRSYTTLGVRKSGEEFDLENRCTLLIEGDEVYTLVISRDVTDERRMQHALAESESKFRALFEQTSIGIAHTGPDGMWVTVNHRLCEMLGYTNEELMAVHPNDIIHPDDHVSNQAAFAQVCIAKGHSLIFELRLLRKDGAYLWTSSSISPLCNEHGEMAGHISCVQDITVEKQAAQERAKLMAELEAAYQRERRIAESLQRSLLLLPSENVGPGLEVQPVYCAAWEEASIGGDFYDAVRLPGDRTALVIGDISGKGLAAAARMAEIKYTLRAFLRETGTPGLALERLNDFLVAARILTPTAHDGELFVCISVVVIDISAQSLCSATAGMEEPFIVRHSSSSPKVREAIRIHSGGIPLGAVSGSRYIEQVLSTRSGDILVMSTDGVTDAHNGSDSFFGFDGLVDLTRRVAENSSLEQIGQTILSTASVHAGGHLHDDACLLLARLS